jgi:hypothetical protein
MLTGTGWQRDGVATFAGTVVTGMDRPILRWMGRTLAKGEPLPGSSQSWEIASAPVDDVWKIFCLLIRALYRDLAQN